MKRFTDKVAVITGGNSGIGLATAQLFASEGARVVITGRDAQKLSDAVKQLGDSATGIQADVTSASDLDRLYYEIRAGFGRVDVLFANAGIAPFAPVESVTEEHFDDLFNVNVRGLFFTVQKALPLLA